MASKRVIELKRLLDLLVQDAVATSDDDPPGESTVFEEAVRNFVSGGPELLDQATEFLWAYYRSVAEEFSPEEREDYGIPEIPASADIWDEVEIRLPPDVVLGGGPRSPGRSYISVEGEVSWEPEHGLQLVFEHGLRVCKVGPHDGHVTNARAYADESLLGVVFR